MDTPQDRPTLNLCPRCSCAVCNNQRMIVVTNDDGTHHGKQCRSCPGDACWLCRDHGSVDKETFEHYARAGRPRDKPEGWDEEARQSSASAKPLKS